MHTVTGHIIIMIMVCKQYGCNDLNDLSHISFESHTSFEALINLTDVVGYLLKQIIDCILDLD